MKDCNNRSEATLFNFYEIETITATEIQRATCHDPVLSQVLYFTANGWPELVFGQSLCLDSWRHLMPRSTRFQWRIVSYGVCVSLFWNVLRKLIITELHQDHPVSSQIKPLARSHLWWPGLDLDLEKLAKSCASLSVKQAPGATPLHPWVWPSKPWQRVHINLLAIHGLNVGGWPFQEGWGDRYGQVYNCDKYRGCSSKSFCSVWITRASSVRQRSTVHLWSVYEVSASQWGEARHVHHTIPHPMGLLNVLYALSNKLWRQRNMTDFQLDINSRTKTKP